MGTDGQREERHSTVTVVSDGTGSHTGRARPTLEDVAAHAQVSRATVSRVINGSPKVSEDVRASVEESIRALGYVPNRAARTLVTQRTDSVALVVAEPDTRVFTDPFFGGIVRGVSQELSETGLQLVLSMVQTEEDHHRFERYVQAGHVDGVLLISLHAADPLPTALSRVGIPAVIGGQPLGGGDGLPYVDIDNRSGARAAVSHLLGTGRERIATIAGPQDMCAGVDRMAGYRATLGRSRFRRSLVEVADFTEDGGHACMRALLDRHPDLDAVFAASDLMAAGALRALRLAGRRVPDDVAVVGFDDLELARYTDPPLTTVRQPTVVMGREMARLLLGLQGLRQETARSVLLPTELVIRESA
jgi:DNA-binding LacI/PurR family transcriptional regulator